FVQQGLVSALELPPHRVRVIAPDLGGGFGTKASGYAEDALIPIAARVLGRPVKWIEDRREHMMSAAHARHQTHTIRIGARRDGTIVGLADRIWLDLGAYNVWGIVLPYNTVAHLIGPHRIRDMKVEMSAVVTNKTPNAPYRGAGRPETVFAMDRAVDCLARTLRLDPADVRRKNYIRPDELPFDFGMPYRDGNPLVYDSGDFPAALESALTAAEYDRVRKEQDTLRARGVWRGGGLSAYVEGTAIGAGGGARGRPAPRRAGGGRPRALRLAARSATPRARAARPPRRGARRAGSWRRAATRPGSPAGWPRRRAGGPPPPATRSPTPRAR